MNREKTTEERNEAIAKFMDWSIDPTHCFYHGIDKKYIIPYCTTSGYLYKLCFNSDWNWLMPVVEKLRESKIMVSINYFPDAGATECVVYPNDLGSCEIRNETVNPIEAVFLAVSDFCLTSNPQ